MKTINKTRLSKGLCTVAFMAALMAGTGVSDAVALTKNLDADPRIKTLVYSDNDVFTVVARNGFQTDIELAADETIDTISIGDSIGWQITPATKRIFVKPLQKSGVTNLSVITNRRTYQFELVATNSSATDQDHAYVVKFYYPDDSSAKTPPIDRTRGSLRPIGATVIPELPTAQVAPPAPPVVSKLPGDFKAPPVNSANINAVSAAPNYNFNYTLTGPDQAAPVKIYDDGKSTFFQFRGVSTTPPKLAIVRPDNSEVPVAIRGDGQGRVIVDQLASKFSIRDANNNVVYVYNEKMNLPPVPSTRPY